MIRAIVAIDQKQGLANDKGIPWDLPTDRAYFRGKTDGHTVLMGERTYAEFKNPWANRRNVVASHGGSLREGFELTNDARTFLLHAKEDVWVIGGAGLFATTLDLHDELYITQIEGDFNCTKFFPEYKNNFELADESEPQTENGIRYTYQIWKRKKN